MLKVKSSKGHRVVEPKLGKQTNFSLRRLVIIAAAVVVVGTVAIFYSRAMGTSSISGVAFKDANRNGLLDTGEEVMADQRIELFNSTGSYVAGATTDANGKYSLSGLDDGSYSVAYSAPSWYPLKADWTPTTTDSYLPQKSVSVAGSSVTVDFGWRQLVRSTDLDKPISDKTYPDSLRIQMYNDAVSPDIIYNMLHTGSLVGAEKSSITIRLDYGSHTAAGGSYKGSASTGYCCAATIITIDWNTWLNNGENSLFHEYGHAWSNYYSVNIQQDPYLNGYLKARGLSNDPRVDSSYGWGRYELIAEDYRQLFGSPVAKVAAQGNGELPAAKDVAGLLEYLRDTFTKPPVAPPSTGLAAPTNLTASATQSPEGVAVQLNWTASSGASKYDVYRNNVKVGTVNSPSTTYYDGTGLEPNKTYSYYVRALDANGNQSPASNTATVTTPATDTQSPTTPTNLRTTSVTKSSVSLAWNASTDNIAVTGYRVYRLGGKGTSLAGTLIGTTANLNFTDTNLKAGSTQGYYVVAIDAAGNQSQPSSTLTVKLPRR